MTLNAMYDPITDKIYNCKEGTLIWNHENRHREQFKSGLAANNQMWTYYALVGAVWFLSFDRLLYAQICMIIVMILMAYLEIDAWIYAIKASVSNYCSKDKP